MKITNIKHVLLHNPMTVFQPIQFRQPICGLSVLSSNHRLAVKYDVESTHNHTGITRQHLPPFVKDLFVGKFNKSILSYAEVLSDESHFNLESKVEEIGRFLDTKDAALEQVDRTGKLPPDILDTLKKSGLLGLSIPTEYQGAGFLNTEIARFYELFGCDLSLSEVLGLNEFLGHQTLMKAGSEEQKSKYLPLLANGDMMSTWCLTETGVGSDPDSVACEALEDGEEFVINGTKTWVANAQDAGLFIVFAKVKSKNVENEDPRLSCFLVDKVELGEGDLEISQPYSLSGLKGMGVCDVKFNNCKVSKKCLLGEVGGGVSVLQSVLHQHKYMQAAGIVTNLKELLNETITHTNTRRQFKLMLSEFPLVREKLGKMAAKLYCLESMVYLTAGLADASQQADVEVESVIVKQFAAETSEFIVSGCLELLGSQVNLETSKYQKYIRESHVLQGWQGSANIHKCLVGISGLMHLVNHEPELAQIRQPANGNLIKSFKHTYNTWGHRRDKVAMIHDLASSVHPSLQPTATTLEWCVVKIHYAAQELLVKRGANIQVEEHYLARMSDLVTEVYSVTAALARASRSMSLELNNCIFERNLVVTTAYDSKQRVAQILEEILNTDLEHSNRDEYLEHCGEYISRRGGYVAVHPLTKNSW